MQGLPENPRWELVVADNGSCDGTDILLSSAAGNLPVVAIEEKRPGKSRALNRALKHAQGDLLVFADDDVIPDSKWLIAIDRAATDFPQANVFGGRILVDRQAVPPWIVNSYNLRTILTSEQDLGGDIRWFADGEYPVGPNIAVRRRALEGGLGQWPVNLGPGTGIPVGDERGFLMQVSQPEARDRLYLPGSIVWHNIIGRELNFMSAVTRCFMGGYAAALIDSRHGQCPAQHGANFHISAWQRFRQSSSTSEFFCNSARALGVLAGGLSPYPRNL